MSAFMADMRLDMMRYMNTIIMVKPATASVVGSFVTDCSQVVE
jgi:hypothetical protein